MNKCAALRPGMVMLFSSVLLPVWGQQVRAELDLQFRASYADLYLFRGHVYDREAGPESDLVFGVGSWSLQVLHHPGQQGDQQLGEWMHALEYTTVVGRTVQTMGYRYYSYHYGRPDTQEIFYRVRHRTPWNASYGVAQDLDSYRGTYMDVRLGRSFPLTRLTSFGVGLSLGGSLDLTVKETRNGEILEYGFFEKDGMNHASAAVDLARSFGQHFTVRASYEFHYAMDDLLREDPATGKHNQLYQVSIKWKLR